MMADDNEWIVVFFVDEKGSSPIREFLQNLDLKTQARFMWSIEQLRVRNVRAQEPLVRHLEGKLWELREESGTNIYRLLYFFFSGRRIVFVHGFQKKTQKTPRHEIEIALQRLDSFTKQQRNQK
ncbi:MAG: type II toxin-antitoxin system RelE/ParE family toxin [Ktedonobacteraceae bacterium]